MGPHFGRRTALLLVHVGRNSAAVIDNGYGIIHVDRDLDRVAIAGQGLVDRVVDDLVNQVVETDVAGGTDVHRRTLTHGITALKDSDRIGTIFFLCFSQ